MPRYQPEIVQVACRNGRVLRGGDGCDGKVSAEPRFRERNSYGLLLDPDIVLQRAQEAEPALSLFHGEVLAMVAALDPTDKPIRPP